MIDFMSLKEQEFGYLADFILKESGVFIARDKEYLLKSRLTPILQTYHFQTIEDFISALKSNQQTLRKEVINAMMTHETFFFRDQKPFETFQNLVLPLILKKNEASRCLRIWSIACSSGQECYSLAMVLQEHFPHLSQWDIEILGTDISAPIIKRAQQGLYSSFEIQRGLPPALLKKYFQQVEGNQWQIAPHLQSKVKFQVHNILQNRGEVPKYDILFCRNVLIYFDLETKEQVLEKIASHLKPEGYIFLGGAETTLGLKTCFKAVEGTRSVYKFS